MIAWSLLLACAPCPDGLVRVDGRCVPDGTLVVAPLSAENFPDRYESTACRNLEDCVCDEIEGDYVECDVDCSPADWSWTAACAFDLEQAERCLSESWACFEDEWRVEEASACALVYDCGAG